MNLALLVTAGDDPEATVGFARFVKGSETSEGIVGIEFAVAVVLMPVEGFGVTSHFEGQLRGDAFKVRADELLCDVDHRPFEIIVAHERRLVVDIGEE